MAAAPCYWLATRIAVVSQWLLNGEASLRYVVGNCLETAAYDGPACLVVISPCRNEWVEAHLSNVADRRPGADGRGRLRCADAMAQVGAWRSRSSCSARSDSSAVRGPPRMAAGGGLGVGPPQGRPRASGPGSSGYVPNQGPRRRKRALGHRLLRMGVVEAGQPLITCSSCRRPIRGRHNSTPAQGPI